MTDLPAPDEDGRVKAGEYEDGTAYCYGEFVEWPEGEGDLIPVGEHECVTCRRCACTFAAVHPACPRCSAEGRVAEAEKALAALQAVAWGVIAVRSRSRSRREEQAAWDALRAVLPAGCERASR